MNEFLATIRDYVSAKQHSPRNVSFVQAIQQEFIFFETKYFLNNIEKFSSQNFEIEDLTFFYKIIKNYIGDINELTFNAIISEINKNIPYVEQLKHFLFTIESFLSESKLRINGTVSIISESFLQVVENKSLLQISWFAKKRGMNVIITPSSKKESHFKMEILIKDQGRIIVEMSNKNPKMWWVKLYDDTTVDEEKDGILHNEKYELTYKIEHLIPTPIEKEPENHNQNIKQISLIDLFGKKIALRDLEPRDSSIRGLEIIRQSLNLHSSNIPRKNQKKYVSVLNSFIKDIMPDSDPHILYVGDTLFNDGSVISNLSLIKKENVYGFLCNEKGFGLENDFIIGPIYFARRWKSLESFINYYLERGLVLNEKTIAFFDLDQTVYAAKGRDDEALYYSRWNAISSFLMNVLPSYKYDSEKAQMVYREFDKDDYHKFTKDNMDYVVLLVMAVSSGLSDISELKQLAEEKESDILTFIATLLHRAGERRGYEEIEDVYASLKAIYYNSIAGDQTPNKIFRKYECKAIADSMRDPSMSNSSRQILLNQEVVDFINYLKKNNCHIMAVSDRPIEAAVIDEGANEDVDIMTIPMSISGNKIF